jgi:hypothetical protein
VSRRPHKDQSIDKVRRTTERLEELPLIIDETAPIPHSVEVFLSSSQELIQSFWDRWIDQPIEQYVACDFLEVWRALQAVQTNHALTGKSFVEWGAGFGVVTALGWLAGFSAVGIEAEAFLVSEGKKLFHKHQIQAELWHGNFLPERAEELADVQSNFPSLHHPMASAYAANDCELGDFSLVFAYPWPGEEHFQREVFRQFAAQGALLLMFRGPYQIELYRKLASDQAWL